MAIARSSSADNVDLQSLYQKDEPFDGLINFV
jgi:hypothetical protein